MRIRRKSIMLFISVAGLVVLFTLLNGCKKSEPGSSETTIITSQEMAKPETGTTAEVTAEIEQTMCPVMGKPIDKDIYVEFLGKKVYFCCEDCQEKFMEDPEMYLDKLPQFKK